jgi:Na+/glutamate symporter
MVILVCATIGGIIGGLIGFRINRKIVRKTGEILEQIEELQRES